MKEFELIKYIRKTFEKNNRHSGLILPIGDDCSVIVPPKGMAQATTIDSLVEGNHFSLTYFTPREIGRKALRVNLSDLASMGARAPYYAWLVFALPRDFPDAAIKGILAGVKEDCARYGVILAGGNITGSAEFQIHLALSGWVKPRKMLTRQGARPGDHIFVTGTIGASTLAYQQFKAGKRPDPWLLRRWANPEPKLATGIFLAEHRLSTACIDVSDGIFQDLGHITKNSGVGAELFWEQLPIFPRLKKLKPTPQMIGLGEDYELLFTVSPLNLKKLKPLAKQITEIGRITKSGFKVYGSSGEEINATDVGFSHLT